MNKNRFLVFLFLIGQIVQSVIGTRNKQIRTDLFSMRNFDISNAIDEILSRNWTQNHECLIELNAIKNGIKNHEEWAIRGK